MQGPARQLPWVLVATLVVVALPPALAAIWLPGAPVWLTLLLCGVLTFALWRGGDWAWRRSARSRDVLFADLMLWGFVRRLRVERRIASVQPHVSHGDAGDVARRLAGLERLAAMVEARDSYTHRHSLRVTRYAVDIARELGLSPEDVARVRTAATLHDVGKYLVPRSILNKPGKLTDEEFAVVKRHPGNGANLVTGLVEPSVVAMIRHHHEKISGRGYPDGLAGDEIPLGARIIAVADTFDAMTSTRAYRSARPHRRALVVLREESGQQLDAAAVAAFERVYSGRRGLAVGWLATALGQALLPLRELVGPSGLARVLPTLGASAAIAAPVLTTGADAGQLRAQPDRDRPATRTTAAATAVVTPAPSASGTVRASRTAPERTRRRGGSGGRPARAQQDVRGDATPGTPAPDPSVSATATPGAVEAVSTPGAGAPPPAASGDGSSPATDAPPAATPAATAAPTSAPEVAVAPVDASVGDAQVELPPVQVDLPDLPVKVPPVKVEIPPLKLLP